MGPVIFHRRKTGLVYPLIDCVFGLKSSVVEGSCHLREHEEGNSALPVVPDSGDKVPQPVFRTGHSFDTESSGDAAMAAFHEGAIAARREFGAMDICRSAPAEIKGIQDTFVSSEVVFLVQAFPPGRE